MQPGLLHPVCIGYPYFRSATGLGQVVRLLFWALYLYLFHFFFANHPVIKCCGLAFPLSVGGFYLTLTLLVLPLTGVTPPVLLPLTRIERLHNAFAETFGHGSVFRSYILECADHSAWLLLWVPLIICKPFKPLLSLVLLDLLYYPAVSVAFWLYNDWTGFVEVWEWNMRLVHEIADDLLFQLLFPVPLFSSD